MPSSFFPSAREARTQSRDNLFIFREIRDIEELILIAQKDNRLEVTVSSTGMTLVDNDDIHSELLLQEYSAEEYFRAWKMFDVNAVATEQMETVIQYFKDLGYSIVRKTNPSTLDTFVWEVKW